MPTIIRDDLSNRLIHLTKGDTTEAAANNLFSIISDRALKGGDGFIKGGHKCVCFSETPVSKLGFLLATPDSTVKYKPYGVMFRKSWIYQKGGRPVIYQSDGDYELLPDSKKHLHVRFFLGQRTIDHTWEREWRIKTDLLEFSPEDVTIIIPTRRIIDELISMHFEEVSKKVSDSGSISHIERFPWHYIILEDLGVELEDGI